MSTPHALVLTGDGINCEQETAEAFRLAGFEAEIRHLNDLIAEELSLDQLSSTYQALALPGGFSFGDDLTSGRVLALKIRRALGWDLSKFATRGGLVIGICNGFQALLRLGIFGKDVSITHNHHGKFVDTWVGVEQVGKNCVWLKGFGTAPLPVRHGEGRVVLNATNRSEVLEKFDRNKTICLRYEGMDPNGSDERIAGLSDPTGRIFGLMPHPEAFLRWTAHPSWTADPDRAGSPGDGLKMFQSAYQEVTGSGSTR